MIISNFSQFSDLHVSVLQELGNMGSGGAATALADMLGTPTDISVPIIKTVGKAEATVLINTLSSATISELITLSGDMKGHLLHIIPFKFAEKVINTYFPGTVINNAADLDEMGASVINELVNIPSGSYVNAMAQLTGMFIDISTPGKYADTASAIIGTCHVNENAFCFVNNTIIISDCNQKSNMLFFPEFETIKVLMNKLGIEC